MIDSLILIAAVTACTLLIYYLSHKSDELTPKQKRVLERYHWDVHRKHAWKKLSPKHAQNILNALEAQFAAPFYFICEEFMSINLIYCPNKAVIESQTFARAAEAIKKKYFRKSFILFTHLADPEAYWYELKSNIVSVSPLEEYT